MINFAHRNIKIFFRDRTSVFFSLLSVFIIIGLYALFLGNVWLNSLEVVEESKTMMNSWIMAGLLAVTGFTTTMGANGQLIEDKVKKVRKDFYSTPIPRSSLIIGYLISAFVVGVIMSLVTFILAEIYITINGGTLLSVANLSKIIGVILLGVFNSVALLTILVLLLNSNSAYSSASIVIGTLVGFLTGIYLPIGELPEFVQKVITVFPPSHAASLMRKVFMEKSLLSVFEGAPAPIMLEFRKVMGVDLYWQGEVISSFTSVVYLLVSGVIFLAIAILISTRKSR